MNKSQSLNPLPFWQALVLFGIPGIIVYLNIYLGVPFLVGLGVPLIICFPPLLLSPVLLPASLVLYKREGNEISWTRLKERYRLNPIRGRQWLWVAGVFLCAQTFDIGFAFIGLDSVGRWLARFPLFAPPPYLPAFMDPRVELEVPFAEFLGAPLAGNWGILWWWLGLMMLSNLGEEFILARLHSAAARGIPRETSLAGQWPALEFRIACRAQMAIFWNAAQYVVDPLAGSEAEEHLGIFSRPLWRKSSGCYPSLARYFGCSEVAQAKTSSLPINRSKFLTFFGRAVHVPAHPPHHHRRTFGTIGCPVLFARFNRPQPVSRPQDGLNEMNFEEIRFTDPNGSIDLAGMFFVPTGEPLPRKIL